MKERIKKFFKENDVAILSAALAVGTAVGTAFAINKIVDGKTIVGIGKREFEDGVVEVKIDLKNGLSEFAHWIPKPE